MRLARTLLLGVLAALTLTATAAAAQIRPVAQIRARPIAPVAQRAPGSPARILLPLRVRNPAALARAKAAAARRQRRAAGSSQIAVFGGLSAPGVSAAQGIAAYGEVDDVSPPDTTGAIGPSAFVEFTNGLVSVYNRSNLAPIGGPLDLATFTGDTGFLSAPCDPQVKFDPLTDRWFYTAIGCYTADIGKLFVGWSKTPDPSNLTSGWCKFAIAGAPVPGLLPDYDKLGLDGGHIVIGSDLFDSNLSFVSAEVMVSAKPPAGNLSSCAPPSFSYFGSAVSPLVTSAGNLAFAPEPATVAGTAATGYLVAADFDDSGGDVSGSRMMVWQVGDSAGGPTLTARGDLTVPGFSVPPPVPQPGTSDAIDSADGRLTAAVAAPDPAAGGAEAIWTQHTIAGGSGSVVRWYELLPASMSVRQAGTVSDPAGFAFNGAIAPTLRGGAVLNYDVGGPATLVGLDAQARTDSTPLGTLSGPLALSHSSAIDNDFSCPSQAGGSVGATSCRWGDYAGASVDPVNPNLVWGANQVNGPLPAQPSQSAWLTQIFAITPDLPPVAALSVSPDPGTAGTPVSFSAAGSSDPDGTITSYVWNFGDGHTATGAGTSHTYAAPGTYTVTLGVVDNGGEIATATRVVTIKPKPLSGRLSISTRQKLSSALAHGLVVALSANEPMTASIVVRSRGQTLLKVAHRTINSGTHRITLKFSAGTVRKLRAAGRLKLTIRIDLRDAFGQHHTISSTVTLSG